MQATAVNTHKTDKWGMHSLLANSLIISVGPTFYFKKGEKTGDLSNFL